MMHGHEKSDSVIVAVKPANKAGANAAEPVEPRTGTKGNADQQSTCRAQNRVSVTQALERIRQVAKERKKERFTGLFHHISIDLLSTRTRRRPDTRSPSFRCDPFARDVALDPGRASAPRVTVPHMLPSSE